MWFRLWLWVQRQLGADPRTIFRFWDGRRWRAVDPIPVYRALCETPGFHPEESLEALRGPDESLVLDATKTVSEAVRSAFDIKPLDAGGLTETECLSLYADFREYLGPLKKSTGPNLSSLATTAPQFSVPSPTNVELVSG